MIEQQARVVRTEGDIAWISVGGQSGCVACDAGKGCGAGVFGRLLRRKPVELAVLNRIEARAGQAVTLGLPEALFIKLVFRLYGWPLVAALACALMSHQIGVRYLAGQGAIDLLTLLGMISGAALVIAFLRHRRGEFSGDEVRLVPDSAREDCNTSGLRRSV